jgi:NAD(P)-dependent dehydrogenase (short-subunit alcohol dehydrogenase family)
VRGRDDQPSFGHPDGWVTPVSLDVTIAAQIQAAAGSVESLDILVNNAVTTTSDDRHHDRRQT